MARARPLPRRIHPRPCRRSKALQPPWVGGVVPTPVELLGTLVPSSRPGSEELLGFFLRGVAPHTVLARRSDLRAFARYLGTTPDRAIAALLACDGPEANRLALGWLQAMTDDQKLYPATVARRMSTLRALVQLGRLLGAVDWHLEVPSPRVENYRDTRGPEVEDIRRMLEEKHSGYGPMGARNRTMIVLATTLGLRRAEIAALTIKDVDLKGRRLFVHGKGSRAVWVTLPAYTQRVLEAWLAFRAPLRGKRRRRLERFRRMPQAPRANDR